MQRQWQGKGEAEAEAGGEVGDDSFLREDKYDADNRSYSTISDSLDELTLC